MRAKVLRSFVSNQPRMRASTGETIEVPDGVDWVKAGFVEPLPDEEMPEIDLEALKVEGMDKKYQNRLKKLVEDTTRKTPETAVTRAKGSQPKPKPPARKAATKTSRSGKK